MMKDCQSALYQYNISNQGKKAVQTLQKYEETLGVRICRPQEAFLQRPLQRFYCRMERGRLPKGLFHRHP